MSTPASAQAPSPSDTPLSARDSAPGPASKAGCSQTALPCPGAEKPDCRRSPCFRLLLSTSWPPPPAFHSRVCLSVCLHSLLLGLPAVPDCPLPPSLLPCPLPAKSRTDISGSCGLCGPHSCLRGLCGSSPLGGKPRVGPLHLPLSCALLTNPTQPSPP